MAGFRVETFYMKRILLAMAVLVTPVMGEDNMRDFIGAVYKNRGTWIMTDKDNALGNGGCIRKVGDNYFTPNGFYRKVGNTYLSDTDDPVVSTGSTFLSSSRAVVKTGSTYLWSGGNKVSTGSTILDSEESDTE